MIAFVALFKCQVVSSVSHGGNEDLSEDESDDKQPLGLRVFDLMVTRGSFGIAIEVRYEEFRVKVMKFSLQDGRRGLGL